MTPRQERILQSLFWMLPTWPELIVYLFLSLCTFALSSQAFLKSWLYVPKDYSFFAEILRSIDTLLPKLLGERIGSSLPLGVFWGAIGMVVYVMIWIFSNFSTELNNELVLSKYVHPRNIRPQPHVRQFITKTIFRIFIGILFILYANICFRVLFPLWASYYQQVIANWGSQHLYNMFIWSLLGQMLTLHGFTIFTRLFLLRKRVFDY